MTSMPAEVVGLNNRGSIASGKIADIVVFDPHQVKERATYAEPHQLAEGFDWVLIGGEIARQNGITLPERRGRVPRPIW